MTWVDGEKLICGGDMDNGIAVFTCVNRIVQYIPSVETTCLKSSEGTLNRGVVPGQGGIYMEVWRDIFLEKWS